MKRIPFLFSHPSPAGRTDPSVYGVIVCVILSCLFSPTVSAQSGGRPANLGINITSIDNTATDDQKERITAYVDYWTGQLATADTGAAFDAGTKLIEPAMSIGSTIVFRMEYSNAALSKLENTLSSADEFRAVLAMRAIGFLATHNAIDVAIGSANPNNEPRAAVRLWATKAIYQLLKDTQEEQSINAGQLETIVRQLGRLDVAGETPMALFWRFKALATVNTQSSRLVQASLFGNVVRQMDRDETGPSELMKTAIWGMNLMRPVFIAGGVNAQERNAFARQLAPRLVQVFEVSLKHWDATQAENEHRKKYGTAIGIAEAMLRLSDPNAPSTNLANAWSAGDKNAFQAELQRWLNHLP